MRKWILMVLAGTMLTACTSNPYTGESQVSNALIGTGAGAGLGAGVGAIVGSFTKVKTKKAIMIGAGVGALAGGAIGIYMDQQEAKLRDRLRATGVSVSRNGNQIVLNMPSHILFSSNGSTINPRFHDTLDSVAVVLREYNKTRVSIIGHTDSYGSAQYNQELSYRRANAVSNYLSERDVWPIRFNIDGRGESQPLATNASYNGKVQNRRVEIQIVPN